MANRLLRLGLVVLLAGSGLGLAQSQVQAQEEAEVELDDLDLMDEDELAVDLADELDDIFARFNPNVEYEIKVLFPAIMYALGDAGDEDDPEEAEITLAELEAEMAEQDTKLEAVVWAALLEADTLVALRGGSPSWRFVQATPATDQPTLRFATVGLSADVPGNGKVKAGLGAKTVGSRVGSAVRR
jgi:hypothetical protein